MDNETAINSTIDPLAILGPASLEVIKMQLPAFFIFWISLGFSGTVGNVLIIATIVKSKSLQSKFMYSMISLSVSNVIFDLSSLYLGLKKVIFYFSCRPEVMSQINCLAHMTWIMLWSTGLADWLTLIMNLDRFLALSMPIFYKNHLGRTYVVLLNLAGWGAATILWGFGFDLQNPNRLLVACLGGVALEPWFQTLYTEFRWIVATPNLVLFFITMGILYARLKKTKSLGKIEQGRARKELDLNMVKMMGIIIFIYIFFKLGSYLAISIMYVTTTGQTQALALGYAGGAGSGIYAASHFWVYLIMSKEFRKCFMMNVLRKDSDKVQDITRLSKDQRSLMMAHRRSSARAVVADTHV